MEITTPLGEDVLLFHGMHAREEMGRLSEYQLDLLSTHVDINPDDILGQNVTVKLALPDDSTRHFNGYVTRFSTGGKSYGRYYRYSAVVRPWLWFLTRTSDCRIFQDLTVPDIVKQVFADHSTADFKFELTGTYRKWTYCVQYRETDFNFVSRLLEEEGIYYYVRHTDGHNTIVLSDSTAKHTAVPGYETIPFVAPDRLVRPELEHISSWEFTREIQPGVYVHDDYDLERPSVDLRTKRALPRNYAPSDYEIFDYPGHYVQKADGEQYAAVRIDELGSQFETAQAVTNSKGVSVGSLFTLEGCPREDQNREHMILAASHDLEFSDYESMPEGAETSYRCSFVAMSSEQQFRPRRATPKPFVQGPQTAMVVGPAGEELYTDKFGRVKVQFHWDRYGQYDENSSCWIRVSHPLAGKGWGSVSTPRIDQEVIVDFLEGDPDQPIITGRVYNAECQPPFGFPAGAVSSGVKSSTHKGSGYNEMSMDDTAGKEKITIHGQYDMNTAVGNNQTNSVAVDQTEDVGAKREVSIGASDKVTIGANRDTSIGAKHTLSVGGDEKVTVSGSRDATVAGKEDVSISGKSSLQVGGSRTETITGAHTIVNPRMTITSAAQFTVAAGSNFTGTSPKVNLLAGSAFLANSGGKMDVKSAAALTQQSGAAMNINAGAGMNVQSKAAMNLKSGAALKSEAGGTMNLKAGGTITGKGSSIKLNSPTNIKGTTLTVK
jgi:type VI secretion system secreted protein VgrG